jgi:hypothetical protein
LRGTQGNLGLAAAESAIPEESFTDHGGFHAADAHTAEAVPEPRFSGET